MKNKISPAFSFALFFAGILLGLTLAALSTWADLEANFYGFTRLAKTPLQSLTCPVMMSTNENREVTVKFTNTNEKTVSPVLRTEISTPALPESEVETIQLAPGESVVWTKKIGAKNIDLQRFIFVKAFVYSIYPLPNEEGFCGVFILPLRGNGTWILTLLTSLSLLLTGAGSYFLRNSRLPAQKINPLFFSALLLLPTLIFSFLGWWIQSALLIVVLVLTLFIALGKLATH